MNVCGFVVSDQYKLPADIWYTGISLNTKKHCGFVIKGKCNLGDVSLWKE